MNILVLLPEEIGSGALINNTIYFHAKAWVSAGHNVTLFIPSKEKSGEEILAGINCIYRKTNPFSLRLSAPVMNFLNGQDYDLIVEYWKGLPFFTPLYSKARKLIFLETSESLKDYRRLHLGKIYKDADYLITSLYLKKDLACLGIDYNRIILINKGYSASSVFNLRSKDKTLLYISSDLNNSLLAFEIFNSVERRDNSWKYEIFEDGKSDLKSIVRKSEIAEKIKIYSGGERKKHEVIAEASLLLLLDSIDVIFDNLSYASLAGTPVLSFKYSELKDLVENGENGLLLKDSGKDALIKEILRIGQKVKELKVLTDKCKKFGQRYTWEYIGKQSCRFIESL